MKRPWPRPPNQPGVGCEERNSVPKTWEPPQVLSRSSSFLSSLLLSGEPGQGSKNKELFAEVSTLSQKAHSSQRREFSRSNRPTSAGSFPNRPPLEPRWQWRSDRIASLGLAPPEYETREYLSLDKRYQRTKRWLTTITTKAGAHQDFINALDQPERNALAGLSSRLQGTVETPEKELLRPENNTRPSTAPVLPSLETAGFAQQQDVHANEFLDFKDSAIYNALREARIRSDQKWDARYNPPSRLEGQPKESSLSLNRPEKKAKHQQAIMEEWLHDMCGRMVVATGLVAQNGDANVYDNDLADPLQAVGLGRRALQAKPTNLPVEVVDRLFASLYLYSAGFQTQVLEVVTNSPNRAVLVNKIWQAYLMLLECAEPSLYEWSLKAMTDENQRQESRRTAVYMDTIRARASSIDLLTTQVAALRRQSGDQRNDLLHDRLELRKDQEKVLDSGRDQQSAVEHQLGLRTAYQELCATCARTSGDTKRKQARVDALRAERTELSAARRDLERDIDELNPRLISSSSYSQANMI